MKLSKIVLTKIKKLTRNELITNSAQILILKVLTAVTGFILSALIARSLGAENAGFYFFTLSFFAIVSVLVKQGGEQALTRFIASSLHSQEKNQILKWWLKKAYLYAVIFSSLLLLINLWKGALLPLQWQVAFQFTSLLLLFVPVYALINQALLGNKDFFAFSFSSLLVRLIHCVILYATLFSYGSLDLNTVLVSFIFANLITLFYVIYRWKFKNTLTKTIQSNRSFIELTVSMYKARTSLWISSVLSVLSLHVVPFFLGFLNQLEQVSYFAVSNQLTMLLSFVLMSITHAISPNLAKNNGISMNIELKNHFIKARKLMIYSGLPIVFFTLIFSKYLLAIFGDEFKQAQMILVVLLLGHLIKLLAGPTGQFLVMTGREKQHQYNLTVSISLLLAIGSGLTLLYGAIGGACGVFISMTTNSLLGYFQVNSILRPKENL
jgi:O-antigen/teichoic acid export membrane protein